MRDEAPHRTGSPRELLWLIPPVAVGATLRLWGLGRQLLGGDELHGLRSAVRRPVSELAFHYQANDNAPPIAALLRALSDAGVGLDEWVVRGPALAAGLLALLAFPWLGARLGAPRALLAWLVAVSPALVLYSRVARSYMPTALLGAIAAGGFLAWWTTRSRSGAAAYVLAAVLALWMHPLAAPFVLAPLAFGAADLALRREAPSRPGPAALAGIAGALALLLAPLLALAGPSLAVRLADGAGAASPTWATLAEAFALQAGSISPPGALLFAALAALGLAALARRRPLEAAYGAWLVVAQVAAVLVIAPAQAEIPRIFHRYVLVALPVLLAWVALGIAAIPVGSGRAPLRVAVAALAVGALVAAGPFVSSRFFASSFTTHNDFLALQATRVPKPELPAGYAALEEDGSVVEFPWPSAWRFGRAFYLYQLSHRRRVFAAPAEEPMMASPRIELHNLVPPTPRALRASGARYVVVHTDLAAEELALGTTTPPPAARARLWRRAADSLARQLEARWGPPLHDGPIVQVWDLDALKAPPASAAR